MFRKGSLMKTLMIALTAALTLPGCYTMTPLAPGETVPPESTVLFRLEDGMEIMTDEGGYAKTPDGYYLTGERTDPGFARFDSTITDGMIDELKVSDQSRSKSGSMRPGQWAMVFVLHDGRQVMAMSDRCRRIADGYEVRGWVLRDGESGSFAGPVSDAALQQVLVSRFDIAKTIFAVGVPVAVVTAGWIILSNFKLGGSGIAGSFKMF